MTHEEIRIFATYNRKTKRKLIEMLMYATDKKRLERECLVSLLYKLEELRLNSEFCKALPESEKREINNHLNEIEIIVKFNISEIDKLKEEEE